MTSFATNQRYFQSRGQSEMITGLLEGQNRNSVLFSRFLICFREETQELPSRFSLIPPPGLDPGHGLKTFSKTKVTSDAKILEEALVRMKKCLPFFYLILLRKCVSLSLTTAMVFLNLLRSTDEVSRI